MKQRHMKPSYSQSLGMGFPGAPSGGGSWKNGADTCKFRPPSSALYKVTSTGSCLTGVPSHSVSILKNSLKIPTYITNKGC